MSIGSRLWNPFFFSQYCIIKLRNPPFGANCILKLDPTYKTYLLLKNHRSANSQTELVTDASPYTRHTSCRSSCHIQSSPRSSCRQSVTSTPTSRDVRQSKRQRLRRQWEPASQPPTSRATPVWCHLSAVVMARWKRRIQVECCYVLHVKKTIKNIIKNIIKWTSSQID